MVGSFTRPVCLGPRAACHCLAPSPWSSSHCPLTLLRERSSRLEFPWPEVIDPPLVLAEKIARLEVCEEMDQAHLAQRSLDLGDGGAYSRLVRGVVGEEAPEPRLGVEQTGALRARLDEH